MHRPQRLLLSAAVVAAWGALSACATTEETVTRPATKDAPPVVIPTDVDSQTLVFHNARLALREGRPNDVLRLWLLRNALLDQGIAPTHDDDFRSVVWAALGETGVCPDGFIEDDRPDIPPDASATAMEGPGNVGGAGLWPLAAHNWLLKSRRRQLPTPPPTWDAIAGGMQERLVSLYDVLDAEELDNVRFAKHFCLLPWVQQPRILVERSAIQWVDMDNRLSVGLMMRDMVHLALARLDPQKVTGRALLQTRLFDLDTELLRLQQKKAREQDQILDQVLREAGVAPGGRFELLERQREDFGRTPEAELWRDALHWSPTEWLTLSRPRALSLFDDADQGLQDVPDAFDAAERQRLVLGIVDELIARGDGVGLTQWLGFVLPAPPLNPPDLERLYDDERQAILVERAEVAARLQAEVTLGERGDRLLGLDPAKARADEGRGSGFRERSVIALHQGVDLVKRADLTGALQRFAFALAHADESRDADKVHNLSRRWLAFVLAQFSTSSEVIQVVETYLPISDIGPVLESLLWRAAFHGDVDSADAVCAAAKRRKAGTVRRQCERLAPLVRGDANAFWTELVAQGDAGALRAAERLVDELSTETLDVRANQGPTLRRLLFALDEIESRNATSMQRRTRPLRQRVQGLLDTIDAYETDQTNGARSPSTRLDASAPDAIAYAGSVRLAPADPLPWPFPRPKVTPPSPFTPIKLIPVERRDVDGQLLYAWRLEELAP